MIGYLNTNLSINIKACDVSVCHTVSGDKKRTFDMPKIIVGFVSRKKKIQLLMNSRKLKGTCVYINQHLTYKNSQIAHAACILNKKTRQHSLYVDKGL